MCVRVFSVGFGPGLDSMFPARSRRSASHAVGARFPKKLGGRRGGVGGYNLHSVPPRLWHTNHEQAVSVWCLSYPLRPSLALQCFDV